MRLSDSVRVGSPKTMIPAKQSINPVVLHAME